MSVSPLEKVNAETRGDDESQRVSNEDNGGGIWERVMEPFDQDKEEEEVEDLAEE